MAGQSLKVLTKFKVTFAPLNFLSMIMDIVLEIMEKRRSNLENDRGRALIITSMVEELLERAILTKMRPLSKRDHDALFTGDAPLSTVSAKIKLGYALNLFGPIFRADLNRLREIRNVFAHAKLAVSLETTEIKAVTEKFEFWKLAPTQEILKGFHGSDGKAHYLRAVLYLIIAFCRIVYPEIENKDWPSDLKLP